MVRENLRSELSSARQLCATRIDEVKKLEVEKIALEMDKEVLEREKAELQQQVDAIGKHGGGAESIADWRNVAEFGVRSGAKAMVKNALCSPELKDWLLCFTATYTDIRYTKEVTTVYKAKL